MAKKIDIIVGADGGASKTRVRVCRLDTGEEAEGTWFVGTSLYVNNPAMVSGALESALARALSTFGDISPRIRAACVGTAGIAAPGDVERHRSAFLDSQGFDSLRDRLSVVGDTDIIHALSDAPVRVALIAGTGSNCYAACYDDAGHKIDEHYAGGLGLDLADQGSAAWVGHMACRRAVEFANADEQKEFVRAVYRHLGVNVDEPGAWRELLPIRQRISKRDLAILAEQVVAPLAERGPRRRNPASRILSEAATDLIQLAIAPLTRLRVLGRGGVWRDATPVDFLLVGGMWNNDRVYGGFAGWHAFQKPHVRLLRQADPAAGALKIASTLV